MHFLTISLLLTLTYPNVSTADNVVRRPNVLVFMADDLGIGDLGCFGNSSLATPNIDRLCVEGVKLEHLSTPSSLCTPSRAAFLTSRYAHRSGLSGGESGPRVIVHSSSRAGLPDNATTWAQMMQEKKYTTAMFGKWHLGWDRDSRGDHLNGPLTHGFDSFMGLPLTLLARMDTNDSFFTYHTSKEPENPLHSHGLALALSLLVVVAVYDRNNGYLTMVIALLLLCCAWVLVEHLHWHKWMASNLWWKCSPYVAKLSSSILMSNVSVVEQPLRLDLLTERLTSSTMKFIREHVVGRKNPFALVLSFPSVHVPLHPHKSFRGLSKHGAYGDSVMELDDSVGRILNLLDELKVADDTFVFFLSDHGAHIDLGEAGGSNAPFRGGKTMSAREGGVRIPGVMRWVNGGLKAGFNLTTPVSLLDFGPTLAEILDEPFINQSDGLSILGLLRGLEQDEDRMFRHYCGHSIHALRLALKNGGGVYKAVFREPEVNENNHCGYNNLCPCFDSNSERVIEHVEPILYDVLNDPQELRPLSDLTHTDLRELFKAYLKQAEGEWRPQSQLQMPTQTIFRPWMQICANFPKCSQKFVNNN